MAPTILPVDVGLRHSIGDGWNPVDRRQQVQSRTLNSGGLAMTGMYLNGWQIPDGERWLIERIVVTSTYPQTDYATIYGGLSPDFGGNPLGTDVMDQIPLVASASAFPGLGSAKAIGIARQLPPLVALSGSYVNLSFTFSAGTPVNTTVTTTARMDWVVYREVSL